MPFSRVSFSDLVTRTAEDMKTRTGVTSLLRRATLNVLSRVHAGATHLLYGYLDWLSQSIFATTAEVDELTKIGSEYGIIRIPAGKAVGNVSGTGTNGSAISEGDIIQSNDGVRYIVQTSTIIAGGVFTTDVEAEEGGEDGNEQVAGELSFISPPLGVDSTVTVGAGGLTGGSDEETDAELRARILTRKQLPPHGGAEFDYTAWAKEVDGVTRAWSFPLYNGIGTIGLAFTVDDSTPITPNATKRAEVRAYIVEHEDPASGQIVGLPVTADPGFFVIELTELTVNFEINISPNTTAVQTAITTQLQDFIQREGGPGETLYLSRISEAISSASGELVHTLVTPAAAITAATNQVHVLGTITFGSL